MSRVIGVTPNKKTSADRIWEGVPHMAVSIGGLDFEAPVAVRYLRGQQMLEEDVYGYIHALPGGGRINSNGVICG